MTVRSILLGLLGAAGVCGYTFFNDAILRQSLFVGNHMPLSVYGGLLLFLLLINPLLARLRNVPRVRPFTARELAVVLALSLAACCVPYSSMLRILPRVLMLPHHYVRTEAGWKWQQANGETQTVLDLAPDLLFADPALDNGEALEGFLQGLRNGSDAIAFSDIPWYAWTRTLGFWLPLVCLMWIGLIGLSVALHRQWARHEHLPYPIVSFTTALLPEPGRALGSVFRSRPFWFGTTAVCLFHLNNYLCMWYPEYLVPIRRVFDFRPLAVLFPTFMRGGGWALIRPRFYFSAVAIAYLLATDVSLAVGLGPFIFRYVGGILAGYGIPMGSGTRFAPRIDKGLVFGGYIGFFAAMLYTGRHYYTRLLRRALLLRREDEVDSAAAWGLRVFAAATALFVADLTVIGLDWQLAVLYTVLTVIIFVVMGRIIAETGLFFIAPYLYPCVLIYGTLGERAVGLHALMIMFLLTCVLLIDPRETLMPYVVNSLKLVDDCDVGTGRTAAWAVAAVLLGLAVAVPVTLYFHYDRGATWADVWATKMAPRFAADEVVRIRRRLLAQDVLEEAEAVTGWQRFVDITPDPRSTIAFAAGAVGVVCCVAGRLRFAKWPLHPVLFLVWSGYAGYMMAWSFLLGCFLKTMTTKYGGGSAYQKLKPFMFGLIAGDMLSGVLVAITGLILYWITGELPKAYWVMPG